MSDGADQEPPRSRREAAFRILVGDMHELFAKVDALAADMQTVDGNLKDSARAVSEAARHVRQAVASFPPEPHPIPVIEPQPATSAVATAAIAGLVAGLVAGAIVLGGAYAMSSDREAAKLGRAVQAAVPALDAETRAKLQSAINATAK